jgi:hypothetical protein
MKGFAATCVVLAATLALLALARAARAEGDGRWVQTPSAFLRAGPGRGHAATARLTIATRVEVLSCSASWCEVTAPVKGETARGFMSEGVLGSGVPQFGRRVGRLSGKLAETGGPFHRGEVPFRDGDEVLALCQDQLVAAKVKIERVVDVIVDLPGRKTAQQVSVPGCPKASWVFAVPGLAAGAISPVPVRSPLVAGDGVRLALGKRTYRLSVRQPEGTMVSMFFLDQTPLGTTATEEKDDRLLWAGDLDNDGAIDLIVNLSQSYNVSAPTLFLSSAGAPGRPAPVAMHVTTGC